MLIILEGLDKTGKTTLASALVERLGFGQAKLRHFARPEQHPLDEYVSWLDSYDPRRGRHLVCDRYHWGETIWPEIYDRPTEYSDEAYRYTELFLRSRGAVIVHCTASVEDIVARLDGEPYPPADRVADALRLFELAARRTWLPSIRYDFAIHDLDLMVATIIEMATIRARVAARPWEATDHWVGFENPDVLLVGDRPGPGENVPILPFFPRHGGSSVYLNRAIIDSELHVALTNVNVTPAEETPLRPLWLTLTSPPVVALGNAAHLALEGWDIPHGVVPHPQWVRRFAHDHLREYGQLLREAADGRDMREETRTWRTW